MRDDTVIEPCHLSRNHLSRQAKMVDRVQHVEAFTPAEAEALSGIGTALQRDHRRRFPNWLPQKSGHARFDLFQCLQMRFVADASELGIGPAHAYQTGEWVAHHALAFALNEPGCVAGDLSYECTLPDANEDEIREYTARRVFAEAFGRPKIMPNEFAFVWGDGTDWFGPSFSDCLEALPREDPRRGKPTVAVHLPSFARQIVVKLPRPAVRILVEA